MSDRSMRRWADGSTIERILRACSWCLFGVAAVIFAIRIGRLARPPDSPWPQNCSVRPVLDPSVREVASGSHDRSVDGATAIARVREQRAFAISLVTGVIGLAWLVSQAQAILSSLGGDDLAVDLTSLLLLGTAVAYLTSWYWGTYLELEAVDRVGPELLVLLPRSGPALILVSAFVLSALAVASPYPLAFAALFFAVKLIELYSEWPLFGIVRANIELADQRRELLAPRTLRGVEAVSRYYLGRPWVQVSALVLGLIGIAIAAAVAGWVSPRRDVMIPTTAAASLLLVLAMVVNESIAWAWRREYLHGLNA